MKKSVAKLDSAYQCHLWECPYCGAEQSIGEDERGVRECIDCGEAVIVEWGEI